MLQKQGSCYSRYQHDGLEQQNRMLTSEQYLTDALETILLYDINSPEAKMKRGEEL